MKITIDFETRSECDIKKCGAWIYSKHPSTKVLCMAVKVGEEAPALWIPDSVLEFCRDHLHFIRDGTLLITEEKAIETLQQASIIEAHNAFFERAIIRNTLKWPVDLTLNRWRCSAAKAASYALPRQLGEAGLALGLETVKDDTGHRMMLKISKPRKPTKHDPSVWHETDELIILFNYCLTDVDAEHALSSYLSDLPPQEQNLWYTDQIINERGIHIDVQAVNHALNLIDTFKKYSLKSFQNITQLNAPTQVAQFIEWLKKQGLKMPNLQAATVTKALEKDLPPIIREPLKIRQALSKSSTAKFTSMIHGADTDNRIRDTLLYHGASTGRWAGQKLQPHNMIRDMPKNFEQVIADSAYGYEFFTMLYGNPMKALSQCLRGFITAAPGNELLCADYSSIEGRVLAWVAEENYILDNYRAKKDAYCVFASQVFGTHYEEILQGYKDGIKDFEEMRFVGKTGELACGYQGGEKAVKNFAPDMPKDQRKNIVKLWRNNRPKTKDFWKAMEKCAINAVVTRQIQTYNNIHWFMNGRFLQCRLPSGRLLSYCDPTVKNQRMYCFQVFDPETEEVELEWKSSFHHKGLRVPDKDFDRNVLKFMGVGENWNWSRQTTYGGKLTENIVQAIARDILAEGIMRLEVAGYPVVMHVHDEAIAEVKAGTGNLNEFTSLLSEAPQWALDCPIAAEGFRTFRYHK